MSIKPIDYQIALPRTLEASRINNEEQIRNQTMQKSQAILVQNTAQNKLKQVYNHSGVDEVYIKKRQEKKQKEEEEKKKKINNEATKNVNKKSSGTMKEQHRLDIRL